MRASCVRTKSAAKLLLFFETTKYFGKKVQFLQVKIGCFLGALAIFGEGEIDNQWFKGAKMTIVPRPMHDVCMMYACI
nr:hypothetical protein [Paludibacteraceae bacterium]